MPMQYLHLDAARRAIDGLHANPRAQQIFLSGAGPSAADLQAIARKHPAYVALGAIGPDLFFLLPDFKGRAGMLFGAAGTIKDIYEWWDTNFKGPYDKLIGPIEKNRADELGALTGGLSTQLNAISSRAFAFLIETVKVLLFRNVDLFSLLGSGTITGVDEQTFYWSDMLHYRKTFEFGAYLWEQATAAKNEQAQAFVLGWMAHMGGDVSGHCFVNEKCGGPYRLHWQRHHLVESHMDARVYDLMFGNTAIYNMMSNSALHLWYAFNPDGTSRFDFFQPQPGPPYASGHATPDVLDRDSKWEVKSEMPAPLAKFIADALRGFYAWKSDGGKLDEKDPNGMWASHPTIIEDLQPGSDGYPDANAITTMYWWMYHLTKWTTTDYYKIHRPPPPEVFNIPPFPSPPGTGASDPGPGATTSFWEDLLNFLLAILSWFKYILQVAFYPISALISIINSAGTYPIRKLLYEYIEVPLYNMWEAMHYFLTMVGLTYPTRDETNAALHTLGVGVSDVWQAVRAALADPMGGLHPPATFSEMSGLSSDGYPLDLVSDPDTVVRQFTPATFTPCQLAPAVKNDIPSEFLRPWRWPDLDMEGHRVPFEKEWTRPGYHSQGDGPMRLMGGAPGDNVARAGFESCMSAADTDNFAKTALGAGTHLGDMVDFSAWVIARLTRDTVSGVANFNLDADRGYGQLCWDYTRLSNIPCEPQDFTGRPTPEEAHEYRAPDVAGAGWCIEELKLPILLPPPPPVVHVNGKDNQAVAIRYIDREKKDV